jgi:hypothetical protein
MRLSTTTTEIWVTYTRLIMSLAHSKATVKGDKGFSPVVIRSWKSRAALLVRDGIMSQVILPATRIVYA